jgi:NAD(P)-dependent dehydrogenase (short-subunit alcohol dehydrogenase family)
LPDENRVGDGRGHGDRRGHQPPPGPALRQGEPEDIAGACAWLVRDETGYVTGQTIGVNGGRYI